MSGVGSGVRVRRGEEGGEEGVRVREVGAVAFSAVDVGVDSCGGGMRLREEDVESREDEEVEDEDEVGFTPAEVEEERDPGECLCLQAGECLCVLEDEAPCFGVCVRECVCECACACVCE